ncbi:MAG: urease accessory protein UreD [Halobacteriales archaeon]
MAVDAPAGFERYASEEVPQAAVGAPGKDGELDLAFAADAEGRTTLVRDYARVPFHVSGSLDHAPPPEGTAVYLQSPTGGVAQGDRHEVSIEAGPGATALVTTGSATKVQSMEHNYAHARIELSVGDGGLLEYVPEPTILYPDSRFCRSVTLGLGAEATAILGGAVVPGRLTRGEAFEFERYAARTVARSDDRLFEDTVRLVPGDEGPPTAAVLGDHDVFATLHAVTTTGADARTLADRIHGRISGETPVAAASTLPNDAGVWVRVLGDRTESVTRTLHAAWDEARTALVGAPAPDLRKY